jgi:hypothetical protein
MGVKAGLLEPDYPVSDRVLGEMMRFALLAIAAESERIEAAGRSLYEITGDIKDENSLVIQRNTIRARTQNL